MGEPDGPGPVGTTYSFSAYRTWLTVERAGGNRSGRNSVDPGLDGRLA